MMMGVQTLYAQEDLRAALYGKWQMTKYYSKKTTNLTKGSVEFKVDGTFISDGIYFGSENGLYRTDENRSVLIVETDTDITEWVASVKKGVLQLRNSNGSRTPDVTMSFKKEDY